MKIGIMYMWEIVNFFLKSENKLKLLRVGFSRSIERATLLYAFLFLVYFSAHNTSKYGELFAAVLESNLYWFFPVSITYGIWREISFEYKSNKVIKL
jgi:hypothetical protein